MPSRPWVSPAELSAVLGYSPRAIHGLIAAGVLPAHRTHTGRFRIFKHEVDALVARACAASPSSLDTGRHRIDWNTAANEAPFITTAELARRLGVSTHAVVQQIEAGRWSAFKLSRFWLLWRADVDAVFLARHARIPAVEECRPAASRAVAKSDDRRAAWEAQAAERQARQYAAAQPERLARARNVLRLICNP